MKRILVALFLTASLSGCMGISPRLNEEIDNQGGKIEDIRNNQNGMMLELGKLRQQNDIQNSNLKEVQQGMVNMNAALSRNENSGIQILQGEGPLILVFALGVIGLILWHYRSRAVKSEKAAEIIAQKVSEYNDEKLNNNIFVAAAYTDAEKEVHHFMGKQKRK